MNRKYVINMYVGFEISFFCKIHLFRLHVLCNRYISCKKNPVNSHYPDRWMTKCSYAYCAKTVFYTLTHWGRVTHICVGKLTIFDSDNGLSPVRRQAIIWTNAEILLIGPLGTNFSEILIVIQTFSLTKMHLKMASAKWRGFCLGLNVLNNFLCVLAGALRRLHSTWKPSVGIWSHF